MLELKIDMDICATLQIHFSAHFNVEYCGWFQASAAK